ncbi:beta-mannanase [Paenibacillus lautus]|uniref:beta-mannanase n=1 Tax=Paenibacillus lautus TaxID=1401 RepID=UPI002DBD00D3|nr:beta-mannanase [Paenibacillus lautus]MEC0309505.1 beta-mannanase [Paenibacillus lautus]
MRYKNAEPGEGVIQGLSYHLDDGYCTLRWSWPPGLQAVYIHRAMDDGFGQPASDPQPGGMRLYTRDEYKANNGYRDRLDGIGQITYTVYALSSEDGEMALIRQPDETNSIRFSTGKARLVYSIREKSRWLQPYKTIEIQVTAEVPVPKEALCYVKKQGAYPVNKEDGILYPFVTDFAAGRNVLPAIEVGKNDYVRLFFTDGRKYGQRYELVYR